MDGDGVRRIRRRRAANAPGGRPYRHEVKVSAEQEARLVVLAERHHMTIPRLLVSSTLERSDQITAADKRELLVALFTIQRLLGNLANNVNQIARTANSTGELPEQTGAALTALRRAASRIDCELGRFSLS